MPEEKGVSVWGACCALRQKVLSRLPEEEGNTKRILLGQRRGVCEEERENEEIGR